MTGAMTNKGSVRENSENLSESRKRRNANLRPWRPGQSGNSGGRPKGVITVALLKQLLRKAAKGQQRDLEAIVDGIVKAAKAGNPKAFTAIRDTVDGPLKQESQAHGPQVLIQFTRDRQTPVVKVPSKPAI